MNKLVIRKIEKFLRFVPDKKYLEIKYYYKMGTELDWTNLRTYNEKIQWLKLNERNKEFALLVDKFEVKKIVANIIGEEYVIPTIGVWNKFEEIDFNLLPNQFVLKCTHDSGGIVICKNKDKFDILSAKKIINRSLKHNFFWSGREYPYKEIIPRIIAEPYFEDSRFGELRDYKFFAFNGEPQILFVATDRNKDNVETCFDFFDMNYCHLDIKNGHPNATIIPEKPQKFEEMKKIVEILAKDKRHIRVDLYEMDGKIFFSELTFFHHSGFARFIPEEWDFILGEWLG